MTRGEILRRCTGIPGHLSSDAELTVLMRAANRFVGEMIVDIRREGSTEAVGGMFDRTAIREIYVEMVLAACKPLYPNYRVIDRVIWTAGRAAGGTARDVLLECAMDAIGRKRSKPSRWRRHVRSAGHDAELSALIGLHALCIADLGSGPARGAEAAASAPLLASAPPTRALVLLAGLCIETGADGALDFARRVMGGVAMSQLIPSMVRCGMMPSGDELNCPDATRMRVFTAALCCGDVGGVDTILRQLMPIEARDHAACRLNMLIDAYVASPISDDALFDRVASILAPMTPCGDDVVRALRTAGHGVAMQIGRVDGVLSRDEAAELQLRLGGAFAERLMMSKDWTGLHEHVLRSDPDSHYRARLKLVKHADELRADVQPIVASLTADAGSVAWMVDVMPMISIRRAMSLVEAIEPRPTDEYARLLAIVAARGDAELTTAMLARCGGISLERCAAIVIEEGYEPLLRQLVPILASERLLGSMVERLLGGGRGFTTTAMEILSRALSDGVPMTAAEPRATARMS